MNFIPSLPIVAGIVAGCTLPLVLAFLSHGPWKVRSPGRRFVLAALLTVMGWGVWMAARSDSAREDLLASAMILATAVLAEFTLWTLVAWGFTLSLLMSLSRAQRPLTLDEWVADYTRGGTLDTFSRDRLQLLVRAHLARLDGDRVRLTPGLAPRLAWFVSLLRGMFGVG